MIEKVFRAALMFTLALCFAPLIHAQSGNAEVTAENVKQDTQELISTLKQYSAAQRDEAIKAAEQGMARLDRRIDALESRVDENWDAMNQAAREQARANLKALRKQRNELAEWYGGFKNSSAAAWQDMKQGFSEAYQSIQDAWQKAVKDFAATENQTD